MALPFLIIGMAARGAATGGAAAARTVMQIIGRSTAGATRAGAARTSVAGRLTRWQRVQLAKETVEHEVFDLAKRGFKADPLLQAVDVQAFDAATPRVFEHAQRQLEEQMEEEGLPASKGAVQEAMRRAAQRIRGAKRDDEPADPLLSQRIIEEEILRAGARVQSQFSRRAA